VEACDELLATPLLMQQWVEEADRNDALIPLKKDYKAFSYRPSSSLLLSLASCEID